MMDEAGVQVHWFRPLARLQLNKANHRTHRKVLIVDEAVGFTGGVGIADEWNGDARDEHEWRDTHFRVRGPGGRRAPRRVPRQLGRDRRRAVRRAVDRFPEQPQPGSTRGPVRCAARRETGWSDISTLFLALLQLAEERVRITTAYFVPDDAAERAAVRRGRARRRRRDPPAGAARRQAVRAAGGRVLVRAAARVRGPDLALPAVDAAREGHDRRRVVANIGSANLNARSTELDEEINLVALRPELVASLDAQFDEDLERSEAILPGRWEDRSLPQRVVERTAGLPSRDVRLPERHPPTARLVARRSRVRCRLERPNRPVGFRRPPRG